jgi:hypothetical protein
MASGAAWLSFARGIAEALPIIKAALAAKTIGLIIGFSPVRILTGAIAYYTNSGVKEKILEGRSE